MKKRRAFGTVLARPPRPGFYALFTWQGRRYLRSAGPTRTVAEKKLATAHATLTGGVPVATVLAEVFGDTRGARLTFKDAAPLYLEHAHARKKPSTFAGDVKRLRVLLRAPWAGSLLSHVRAQDLERWAAERQKEGASGATVNRDLALASALFRWAIRQGYVEDNPVKGVERFSEKGRARETYLSAAEARALVASASPILRPLLVAALSTGARRGDLLALRWRDADFDRRELVMRAESEKAGRGRVVPMTDDLCRELLALRAGRRTPALDGSDPLFTLGDGSPIGDHALRLMFEAAVFRCQAIPVAKRDAVTFHTLRHTSASLMVAAGVPIFDVAKILGHSTLAVTMRYAHFAPEAGRAAIARLGNTLGLDAEAGETGEGKGAIHE
ncbi:MAG: site-specific integrase [Planctomycetes bacterium]|nr:site-specific integrase [Planctomycetota bacterium]